MIRFKVDILQLLKNAGYNTGRLRKEKIIGEATIQDMRHGKVVSWKLMNMLCDILKCQPGDLVEYIEDPPAELKESTKEKPAETAETSAEGKKDHKPMQL